MKKTLFYLVLFSSILLITCQKEVSHENGGAPSHGSLLDDGSGDCLPKTVNGAYVAGTALAATNTIQVAVNVTKTGNYTIFSDTVNGYYFRATGIFSTLGSNSVTLIGHGTPAASGVNNFLIQYDSSACNVAVTVLPAGSGGPASFTIQSSGTPAVCSTSGATGNYIVGTALAINNTDTFNVNVTTIGTYTVTSDTVNGIYFNGTGTFSATGSQKLVLYGHGTPTGTGGTITLHVTAGSSTCSFQVTITSGGAGTLGGAGGACLPITVNGTYTAGTILSPTTNTVVVQVNVTTPGAFSITTNTVNGYSFSFSGNLTTSGTVTLIGNGTPGTPGTNTFTVTLNSTPASTCTFTVNVGGSSGAGTLGGAGGACLPITVNGTYTAGTILSPTTNTVAVQVNVTTPGAFSITTNTVNGYSFSFSGNLTTSGTVTLIGNGTPVTQGTNTFTVTLNGTPVSTCTFTVTVNPSSGGAAVFTVDCSTATIDVDALFEAGLQLNCSNKVAIDVNVTTLGTYNITTTATNGMTFSASGTFTTLGIQTITLTGTGTPTLGGTFNIPVNVTPACTFPLTVEPAATDYGWGFTVTNAPATTYKGQEDDAIMVPNPPVAVFGLAGSNTYGTDNFQFAIQDANGTIAVGETYSTSATSGNQAVFQYDLATSPYCSDTYKADPTVTGVSITFTITFHDTTNKIIKGTFTGTAKNNANQTITITSGTFTTEFTPYHF